MSWRGLVVLSALREGVPRSIGEPKVNGEELT